MYVNSRSVSAANQLGAASPRAAVPREAAKGGTPSAGAARTELSAKGQLMSKLSQLEQADPDQLEGSVSTLVAELRQASAGESGLGAKMMAQLAGKLDRAVENGARAGLVAATKRAAPGAAADPGAARSASAGEPQISLPMHGDAADGAAPAGHSTNRARGATPTDAAAAYRANAPGGSSAEDGTRAAIAQVLDQLDAAMKAMGTTG